MKSKLLSLFTISLMVAAMSSCSATQTPKIYQDFLANPNSSLLQDFSYAGYGYGEKQIPSQIGEIIDVTKHGILPNTGEDLIVKIQALIDSVGKVGGGTIFFPKGRYMIALDTTQTQYIKVNYSNILFRGEGQGKDGSIIFSGSRTLQEDLNPWISPFTIRFGDEIQPTRLFWGVNKKQPVYEFMKSASAADPGSKGEINIAPIITQITADAPRGTDVLSVESTDSIKPGDVIVVAMYNTTDDSNLSKVLFGLDEFMPDQKSALTSGPQRAASFQWLVEVKDVADGKITLMQPLRMGIEMKYEPAIAAAPMIRNVGIENMRFESAWNGEYLHHGGGKNSPLVSKIMDYGWNAVNFCRVSHGWMRNVTIDNYTNPIYIQDSRNVTIDSVTFTGPDGHCGIKTYAHANDNLVKNLLFENNFTHMISGEGNAYGNVFSNVRYTKGDTKPGNFDFHGYAQSSYAPPAWNLFENIVGFQQIDGGGAPNNFPHTSAGNVWWNIEGTSKEKGQSLEIFQTWVWKKDKIDKPHYLNYPGSILVGFRAPGNTLTLYGDSTDVQNKNIYTENLNKGAVSPLSLYDAQFDRRVKEKKQLVY